jgi:hypothetical protein
MAGRWTARRKALSLLVHVLCLGALGELIRAKGIQYSKNAFQLPIKSLPETGKKSPNFGGLRDLT